MRPAITNSAVSLLCVAALATGAFAQQAVDQAVQRELGDGMFLGAVVAAGRPNGMLFCKAYGQRAVGQPLTADCLFDVASVTKAMTVAAALAITLDRHPEISLDDRMQKYLPGMTGKGAEKATIRHTATHRSGLDNTKELCAKCRGEELVRHILARDNCRPVDSQYEYSCLGMIRLSEMIAAINKMSFETFCRQEIFAPLGMTNTYFSPVPIALRSRCVATTGPLGIVEDPNARRIGRPVGNAGVFTTAGDLAKLAAIWLQRGQYQGKRLFAAAIADEFAQAGIVWRRINVNELPPNASPSTYFHTGYTGHTFIIDPARNAYIIVLTAWSHPAVKAGYAAGRQARARIAGAVIAEILDKTRAESKHTESATP